MEVGGGVGSICFGCFIAGGVNTFCHQSRIWSLLPGCHVGVVKTGYEDIMLWHLFVLNAINFMR